MAQTKFILETILSQQMKHMKQIYFAGGESLIIQEHYEILEEAIRQGLASIRIKIQSQMAWNGEKIHLSCGAPVGEVLLQRR